MQLQELKLVNIDFDLLIITFSSNKRQLFMLSFR